jgi:hypothetical protein
LVEHHFHQMTLGITCYELTNGIGNTLTLVTVLQSL